MTATLNWQLHSGDLILSGELTRETVLPLWQIRQQFSAISRINVAQLQRVDSAGLALLLHLQGNKEPLIKLEGINSKLATLINLYNLQQVVSHD